MALVVKDEGKIGLHLTTSKTIDLKDQRENARPKYFSGYMETNNINANININNNDNDNNINNNDNDNNNN